MTEMIHSDYEHSSGPVIPIQVPYARLSDVTPTPSNPARVTGVVAGLQLTGTVLSTDAGSSIAVLNVAPGFVGHWNVRNVLTYAAAIEDTWGAINIGAQVYYDGSATMPAGVYLSTSPLDQAGAANTLFGRVALVGGDALIAAYPKGGATASTQKCHVVQRGAGA